jgi:hypothetical protein
VFQNEFDRFLNQAVAAGSIPREMIVTGAQAAGAYGIIGEFSEAVKKVYYYIYADALRTVVSTLER